VTLLGAPFAAQQLWLVSVTELVEKGWEVMPFL
jgi:hypothetical protein